VGSQEKHLLIFLNQKLESFWQNKEFKKMRKIDLPQLRVS